MTPQEAARLREIAERVRRMPPPNHRRPNAFHEARDELAHELRLLAGPETSPPAEAIDANRARLGANAPSLVLASYGRVRVEVRRRRAA